MAWFDFGLADLVCFAMVWFGLAWLGLILVWLDLICSGLIWLGSVSVLVHNVFVYMGIFGW